MHNQQKKERRATMNKIKYLFSILFVISLLIGCSEVDLCESTVHPHQSTLRFDYNWQGKENIKPDTMGVLIYRVVNQYKRLAAVNTNNLTVNSHDSICMPVGDYKFVTFPLDTTLLNYAELDSFMNNPSAEQPLQDVGFEYKQYKVTDSLLGKKLLGWDDYNQYSLYIQPDVNVLFYDSTQVIPLAQDQELTHTFKPRQLTQNVDIYFDIIKNMDSAQFVIDSVWAEISGVPRYINLTNGYLDISKTNKIMFPTVLKTANGQNKDTYTNKTILCHGNVDVLGIVNAQRGKYESEDDARRKTYGPGILQVIIYSHAKHPDTGRDIHKKWQGKINMYTPLQKANLIKLTPDGRYAVRNGAHGVVNVSAKLTIDGEKIISNVNGEDALEPWIQTSSGLLLDI